MIETFGRGKVLYDFVAEDNDGCLNIKEGEVIEVSLREANGWSKARKIDTREEGFVPSTYVQLDDS